MDHCKSWIERSDPRAVDSSTLAMMMRTFVTPSWRRAGLPVGRLLVLLAALAGLFAMHGMSDHGTMQHGASDSHGSAMGSQRPEVLMQVVGGHLAVDAVFASPIGTVVGVIGSAAVADGAVDGGLHAAMAMCLAILAGAAVLALRRARMWSTPIARAVLGAESRLVPPRARAPDPPDLHALSIHRC